MNVRRRHSYKATQYNKRGDHQNEYVWAATIPILEELSGEENRYPKTGRLATLNENDPQNLRYAVFAEANRLDKFWDIELGWWIVELEGKVVGAYPPDKFENEFEALPSPANGAEPNREWFEEKVFNHRFLASIKRNPSPPQPKISGAMDFVSDGCPMKDDLVRRDKSGNYVDKFVSAMWFGYALTNDAPVPKAAPAVMGSDVVGKAREALEASRTALEAERASHGHDHWDKTGEHGRNCKKCIAQWEASDLSRKAIPAIERSLALLDSLAPDGTIKE